MNEWQQLKMFHHASVHKKVYFFISESYDHEHYFNSKIFFEIYHLKCYSKFYYIQFDFLLNLLTNEKLKNI